jgi:hypothetical protein
MSLLKYDVSWVGIDSGREGLWVDPVWLDTLTIISRHEGERIYDETSAVYLELESRLPNEKWRSRTRDGHFRPLFRDYPNAWGRTGLINLASGEFRLTSAGHDVVARRVSKLKVLLRMFSNHSELNRQTRKMEKPFEILAAAFLETPRLLTAKEAYWAIMKNFRPGADDLAIVISKKLPLLKREPEPTPYRRLRNMLTLLRTALALKSSRRGVETLWSADDQSILIEIGKGNQ